MGLSTSRFASLYKNEFKISPTEDLIQTRIDQSKKMLSGSKVSIKKVSVACGFESVHYFIGLSKTLKYYPNIFKINSLRIAAQFTPQKGISL